MTDDSKLKWLLDDSEARTVIFGLAHSGPNPSDGSGPARLRDVVTRLADVVDPSQYQSWLSDQEVNDAVTPEQVHAVFGDDVIDELSVYTKMTPDAVTWQVAAVLPALVDAITPGGKLLETESILQQLQVATADDDKESGPFGKSS